VRPATCTCVECRHHPAEPSPRTHLCKRFVCAYKPKGLVCYEAADCAAFTVKGRKAKPVAVPPREADLEPAPTGEFEQPVLLF